MKKNARQKTFIYSFPGYVFFERFYVFFLKLFRSKEKHPLITADDLSRMQAIARKAYPEYMQVTNDFDSEEKLLRYSSCLDPVQIYHLVSDSYYLIMAKHWNCLSIVDFAAINGICNDLKTAFGFINGFNRKQIVAKCRETTSYPLVLALDRLGRIIIIDEYVRTEYDEVCHVVKFKIEEKK